MLLILDVNIYNFLLRTRIRRSLGPNCTVPDNGCLNNIHRMIRNTNWTGHKLFTNRPRIQYFVSQFLMAIQTVSFSHLYNGVYMTKTRKQEEESRMAWRLDWTNGLPNCSKEFELPPTKLYYVLLALDLIIWPSHNSYKFFWLLSFLNGKVHLTWTPAKAVVLHCMTNGLSAISRLNIETT